MKALCSFNELSFWDRVVLQCSQSNETIQRMIVAIGALHEHAYTGGGGNNPSTCILALQG
jgi:hypothetical protein